MIDDMIVFGSFLRSIKICWTYKQAIEVPSKVKDPKKIISRIVDVYPGEISNKK